MKRPMPEDLIWKLFIQTARGMCALHNMKILHRDIKPVSTNDRTPVTPGNGASLSVHLQVCVLHVLYGTCHVRHRAHQNCIHTYLHCFSCVGKNCFLARRVSTCESRLPCVVMLLPVGQHHGQRQRRGQDWRSWHSTHSKTHHGKDTDWYTPLYAPRYACGMLITTCSSVWRKQVDISCSMPVMSRQPSECIALHLTVQQQAVTVSLYRRVGSWLICVWLHAEIWKSKPYSFSSDTWALGCVLYELCTYKVPFEAKSMQELKYKVMKGR